MGIMWLFFEIILYGLLAFLLWIYWFQNFSHTAILLNQFPGPATPPIIGLPIVLFCDLDKLYIEARRLFGSFNETFRMWAAFYGMVHIVTAEDAEVILSNMKYNQKGLSYDIFKPWLGDGLWLSNGDKWQHSRKILTPTFHFNILRKFIESFGDNCADFTKKLYKESFNDETNIVPLVNDLALANICETAMGTKIDGKTELGNEYLHALENIGECIMKRIFSPWFYNDFIFSLSPSGRRMKSYIKILHGFTRKVILERKLHFKDEDVLNLDNEEDEEKSSKKRLAMLDLLIYQQKTTGDIDDQEIEEQVDTFMFGGQDTISSLTKVMLLSIANHPDVQENIISEMNTIFGGSNRRPTYDDLKNMSYSDMVIKECLRLYPSAGIISRTVHEEIKLSKHTVPAGVDVFIHINHVHRDPRYFPDPEKFDPDRFLPENTKERHPYAYIPFSAGHRNCIGQKFAMLELKSIIAAVFRHFHLTPIDSVADLTWTMDIVLRSRGPIRVKVEKHNK